MIIVFAKADKPRQAIATPVTLLGDIVANVVNVVVGVPCRKQVSGSKGVTEGSIPCVRSTDSESVGRQTASCPSRLKRSLEWAYENISSTLIGMNGFEVPVFILKAASDRLRTTATCPATEVNVPM